MLAALQYLPYPHWLVPGDNAWQLTAATLVGLMSLPGLAVLYAGLVPRKWAVNTLLIIFTGFSAVLMVWVLYEFNMAFGRPAGGGGGTGFSRFIHNLVGVPWPILSHFGEENQAVLPEGTLVPFHFPTATLAFFQFVFAAITPLLFAGSLVQRVKLRAWLLIVPLWSTLVYAVNAFLIWGGGFFSQIGSVDYSGGYVIHLSAGVSGFVAAAILGARSKREREHSVPNNLPMVAVGAGILWLGWDGFNGGDPYYAGVDAAAAVINTNIATAAALLVWVIMDMYFSQQKKPTFLGAVNGMICGLVAITPAAGYVNGLGAILVGVIASAIVWVAWNYLSRVKPFSRVDDAMGVVYTHGIAGLIGGLLVGLFADPGMIVYGLAGKHYAGKGAFSVGGVFYTHSFHQLWVQFAAALWVIAWSAVGTAIVMYVVKFLVRGLREDEETLVLGDVALHEEEAYPRETFVERVS